MKLLKTVLLSLEKSFRRLIGQQFMIKGACRRCGVCCRNMALSLGGRKIFTEDEFLRLKEIFPYYSSFVIERTHAAGFLIFSCTYLSEENLCTNYRKRPHICRSFPDPGSFDQAYHLPESCGYQVIPLREFDEFLKDAGKKQ
ncbi:MAG: YkgJ family cysteine cluster protein [Candidatus Xenobiia bacterium LiM19]